MIQWKRLGVPAFSRLDDPTASENWIQSIIDVSWESKDTPPNPHTRHGRK